MFNFFTSKAILLHFKGESKGGVKEKEKVGEEMKNWAFLMFQFRLFSAIEVVKNIWIMV